MSEDEALAPEPVLPIVVLASTGTAGLIKRRKSRRLTGLLALILGGIGAHRFYLGQVRFGLVYLLLCWTFIPGLIAFVEGMLILTMRDDTFRARYG